MKTFRLGCSGWSYKDWVGIFYPEHTPQGKMLNEYQKVFDTVELNMSFYRFPSEGTIKKWKKETAEEFLFAAKMNRRITHFKKLKGAKEIVDVFMERISGLGNKLGPILIQLPPSLGPDNELLDGFLASLPFGHEYAVEFRHEGWLNDRTLKVLSRYDVALCLVDSPKLKITDGITSSFSYVRWHGTKEGYHGDYPVEEIREWAERLLDLDVNTIYGYWNNDCCGYAPKDCQIMRSMLSEEKKVILA